MATCPWLYGTHTCLTFELFKVYAYCMCTVNALQDSGAQYCVYTHDHDPLVCETCRKSDCAKHLFMPPVNPCKIGYAWCKQSLQDTHGFPSILKIALQHAVTKLPDYGIDHEEVTLP